MSNAPSAALAIEREEDSAPGERPSDMTAGARPLHLLTPVWGVPYVDFFLDISLRSLLSAGNLDVDRRPEGILLHILTDADSIDRIERHPIIAHLRERVGLLVEVVPAWSGGSTHDRMSAYLRTGIAHAQNCAAAAAFFNPDFLYGEGSVSYLLNQIAEGRSAVIAAAPRLLKEQIVPLLVGRFGHDQPISLSPRGLAQLMLECPHPILTQHFWRQGGGNLMPANLYWRVGDEGLAARCYHLHPFLTTPDCDVVFHGTVDDDFVHYSCQVRENVDVVTDTDRFFVCEVSGWSHLVESSYRKGDERGLTSWVAAETNETHRWFAEHPIRIHAAPCSDDLWSQAETEAAKVVDRASAVYNQGLSRLLVRHPLAALRRLVKSCKDALNDQSNGIMPDRRVGAVERLVVSAATFYGRVCGAYLQSLRNGMRQIQTGPSGPRFWTSDFILHRLVWRALWRSLSALGVKEASFYDTYDPSGRVGTSAADQENVVATSGVRDIDGLLSEAAVFKVNSDRSHAQDAAVVVVRGIVEQADDPARALAVVAQDVGEDGRLIVVARFLASRGGADSVEHRRLGATELEKLCPDGFMVEYSAPLLNGGVLWAGHSQRNLDDLGQVLRPSPVLLEVPFIPIMVLLRVLAGFALSGVALFASWVRPAGDRYADHYVLLRRLHGK